MRVLCILFAVVIGCGGSESEQPRSDELPSPVLEKDGGVVAGNDGGPSDGASCQVTIPCDSSATMQVSGDSPFGPVSFDALGVSYVDGTNPATHLAFAGESDGLNFTLIVQLRPDLDGDELIPQAPPGFYEADDVVIIRALDDGSCTLTQLQAEAIVTDHASTRAPHEAEAIRFNGALTIAGDGWNFRVDFQAQRACGTALDR